MATRYALTLLATTAGALTLWRFFPDPAQANAAFDSLLGVCLASGLRQWAPSVVRKVAVLPLIAFIAQFGCTAFFGPLTSYVVGSCDEVTGQPVGALVCVAVLFLAAEVWRVITCKKGQQ